MSSYVAHLKGPEKEGQRKPVYFPTKPNYIEGFNEAVTVQSGSASDTTAAITAIQLTADSAVTIALTAQEVADSALTVAQASGYTLPAATDTEMGGVKLYTSLGTNTDGTVTQAVVSEAINNLPTSGGGGIELADVTSAVITSGDSVVTLKWTDPDDVVYSGSTLARWAGTKVVRKAGSAPSSQTDGTVVVDNTIKNAYASTAYTDSGLTNNTTYYYRFFPYSTSGTYTAGTSLNATPTPKPKATMSLSDTDVSVVKTKTATVTVTTNSDGEISAIPSNGNIVTASVSGSTITITGVATGTTVVTVSQGEGTNYASPDNKTIAVTVPNVSTTLNDNSWDMISVISQSGDGDLYWDVGDAKEITMNGKVGSQLTLSNTKLCVFILDFNYKMNGTAENNIIWGGFKSALTDGKDVALVDAKYGGTCTDGTVCFTMNHRGQTTGNDGSAGYYNTNYGGWKGSDLRYDILGATSTQPSMYNQNKTTSNVGYDATAETLTSPKADTLLAALPSDLRNVIRLWTRWVDATGNKSNTDAGIKATVDAITLLAEFEVFGSRTYANEYEKNHQTQMAYYAAGNGKVRYKHNDVSSAVYWWESSPGYNGTNNFAYVNANGSANDHNAYYVYALAPAFKT